MSRGIVFAIAGDDQIPKLLMAINAINRSSGLPILVYGLLGDPKPVLDTGVQYVASDCKISDMRNASRYLKTSVHKVSPFDESIYFDNDVINVSNASWIYDMIPESGIIFGHDAGKTVAKFSKYATPRKDLHKEINNKFGIKVDSKWKIWNGGLFAFNKHGLNFLNEWHKKQQKVIKGLDGWAKRDQGTLIANVWDFGLQEQECLPKEANFLHKLHSGLKYDKDECKWIHKGSKNFITNIHLCLSWGDTASHTWNRLYKEFGSH